MVLVGLPTLADQRLPPDLDNPQQKGYEANDWLTLKPYVRFSTHATTNLFQETNKRFLSPQPGAPLLRRGGKENDVLYRVMPGVDVVLSDEKVGKLALGYVPTFLFYSRNPSFNTVEQRTRFDGSLKLDKLTLKASGAASWTVSASDPVLIGYIRGFQGGGNLSAEYQFTDLIGALAEGTITYRKSFPHSIRPAANVAEWGNDDFVTISPNLDDKFKILLGGGWREWHYVYHRATRPDVSWGKVGGGLVASVGELFEIDGRAFYEMGWVKRRRGFSRRLEIHDAFNGRGSLTVHVTKLADLAAFTSYRTEAAPQEAYRWTTTAGGSLTLNVREDVRATLSAVYINQNPRQVAELYLQVYSFEVQWFAMDHLEVGAQVSYTRAHIRGANAGYEVFEGALGVTLKL
ncbi:MAG: hypothetical protein AB7T09_15825 [Planctomycetota bacterium]